MHQHLPVRVLFDSKGWWFFGTPKIIHSAPELEDPGMAQRMNLKLPGFRFYRNDPVSVSMTSLVAAAQLPSRGAIYTREVSRHVGEDGFFFQALLGCQRDILVHNKYHGYTVLRAENPPKLNGYRYLKPLRCIFPRPIMSLLLLIFFSKPWASVLLLSIRSNFWGR